MSNNFENEKKLIEDLFNLSNINLKSLSKKEQDDILSLYERIKLVLPDFAKIILVILNHVRLNNKYQEPYKLYYEKALDDFKERFSSSFKISYKIVDEITLYNSTKKRPPYLIFIFKRLFRKLWKM